MMCTCSVAQHSLIPWRPWEGRLVFGAIVLLGHMSLPKLGNPLHMKAQHMSWEAFIKSYMRMYSHHTVQLKSETCTTIVSIQLSRIIPVHPLH